MLCSKFKLFAGLTVILKVVMVWDLPYVTVINNLWNSANAVASVYFNIATCVHNVTNT